MEEGASSHPKESRAEPWVCEQARGVNHSKDSLKDKSNSNMVHELENTMLTHHWQLGLSQLHKVLQSLAPQTLWIERETHQTQEKTTMERDNIQTLEY